MPNDFDDSGARLERLLRQVISEKDPDKCDQPGVEIWRVLNERECIRKTLGDSEAEKGK